MMQLPVTTLLFSLFILGAQSLPQSSLGSGSLVPNCLCTPFYKCHDAETMTSDLDGRVDDRVSIIDNRFTFELRQEIGPSPTSSCTDEFDVCCFSLTPAEVATPTVQDPGQIQTPTDPGTSQIPTSTRIEDGCGVRNEKGVKFSIKGKGGQTQYGEFPWMVALMKSQDENLLFIGGGSLIHPQVVLSAAHKILQERANDSTTVRVGEWSFLTDKEPIPHQNIPVKQVIYHPSFNHGQYENNYILLVLERPAELSETVKTICLPSNTIDRFDDMTCFLSGWGKKVFNEEGKFSRIMKLVSMDMVGHSKCEEQLRATRLGREFILHNSNVCAGDQGQDGCTGDGGSPLVCQDPSGTGPYVQVGVSSYGVGCAKIGVPGVYSAVAPAIDWINQQINTLAAAGTISIPPPVQAGPTTKKPLQVDPRVQLPINL